MGARVLLALRGGAEEAAAALRDAGHQVEQVAASRLESALTSFRPALCVVELEGAVANPFTASAGAAEPAWIALSDDSELLARALAAGADGALSLPVAENLLVASAEQALARVRLRSEVERHRRDKLRDDEWVLSGSSAAAQRLTESLDRVAATPRTTVLVRGRAGSGLGSIARLVHARSARAAGPLVEVGAGAPNPADPSEIFGASDSPSPAEGGSLIVHEVATLPPRGQHALLEFLEGRAWSPASSSSQSERGVRLVATSSRDLAAEVEAGRLREDLLYRLNVMTLAVPSLTERAEDLDALAQSWAERVSARLGRPHRPLSPETIAALGRRNWPGELRELSLYIELVAIHGGEVAFEAGAPAQKAGSAVGQSPWVHLGAAESLPLSDRRLSSLEDALIRKVLDETGGNKQRAAEILGIHRTTLYKKIRTDLGPA
jgi:DNA-binding NtrC family response regulator